MNDIAEEPANDLQLRSIDDIFSKYFLMGYQQNESGLYEQSKLSDFLQPEAEEVEEEMEESA